jgi:glyoxalase family protein
MFGMATIAAPWLEYDRTTEVATHSVHFESDQEIVMQRQPVIKGLHHVSLLSENAERTSEFYLDVLGLERIGAPGEAGSPRHRMWLGDDRGSLLSIIESPDTPRGQLGIGTIHHVSLIVESSDALLKWKRWLEYKQVLVDGPHDQQAYQDLVFNDPDGVLLEIATRGPGWDALQDGQEVYSPPKESMAPFRNEELIRIQTWPQPVTQVEPDMVLQGLHHVGAITSSLERADAFYRDVLRLQLVRKTIDSEDPDVERWYWGLDGGRPGTLVTAFPIVHDHQRAQAPPGRPGLGVALDFALDVGGEEALRDWAADLAGRGLEVTPPDAVADDNSIAVRDPDGQIIELVTTVS